MSTPNPYASSEYSPETEKLLLVVVVLAVSIIGWAFIWAPPIYWAIMRIIAAVKAAQGEFFKYPFTIRLVKS